MREQIRFTILLLSLFLAANGARGQNSNHIPFGTDILDFVIELQEKLDGDIFSYQRKKRLRRQLGFYQNDLDRYLTLRKKVVKKLARNDFVLENTGIHEELFKLKGQITELNEKLVYLRKLSDPSISLDVKDSKDEMDRAISDGQEQEEYIEEIYLNSTLSDADVDVGQLKAKGDILYSKLLRISEMISSLRHKLGR